MENNKRKYLSMLGLITISMFIIGASYAYFTVSTTNNFGTHTISGTMEDVGSVSLVSTGNNISLNLSAADMMQGNDDIDYFGTTDGTPTTDYNLGMIKLADAIVTGPGYYNCNYTLQITATGTNNMYSAFQNFANKSAGQIVIGILTGTNEQSFDFSTANLFPITYNGVISGISSTRPGTIYGALVVSNKQNIDQTILAGTDIQMTATVTSFTCRVVEPTYVYWNTRNNNQALLNNNYPFYIKTLEIESEYISNEVCGVFGSTEVCIKPNDYSNAASYKSQFEAAGATCTSTEPDLISNRIDKYKLSNLKNNYSITKLGADDLLKCSNDSLHCTILDSGGVSCGFENGRSCWLNSDGSADCGVFN